MQPLSGGAVYTEEHYGELGQSLIFSFLRVKSVNKMCLEVSELMIYFDW